MNIRNRKGSRALAVVLALLMIYASMPAALAAPVTAKKDENVYVNLNKNGSVERIYVVNAFEVESAGTITDYGDYQENNRYTLGYQPELQFGRKEYIARGPGRKKRTSGHYDQRPAEPENGSGLFR